MPNSEQDDPLALARAALAEEKKAREALLNQVTGRAVTDPAFNDKLKKDPEGAVREMARSLPPEQQKAVGDANTLHELAQEAQARSALPGLSVPKVESMVFGTIEDARVSYKLTLRLTQILFYFGLGLLSLTLLLLAVVDRNQLFVAVLGGGAGLAGVVASLLINPIDRVQNAAGNLAQLEIAFLSYYKLLSMINLPVSGFTVSDLTAYGVEVDKAMKESIWQIESFCDNRGAKTTFQRTAPNPQ